MTTLQPSSHRAAPAVLVVDDEDYVADMLGAALRLEGYEVQIAYNGRQGFEVILQNRFDLVIIDLMMPYLNGEMLAKRVREQPHLAEVPIILISAGSRPRNLVPSVAFMPKPFDLIHMLALVEAKISASPDAAGAADGKGVES